MIRLRTTIAGTVLAIATVLGLAVAAFAGAFGISASGTPGLYYPNGTRIACSARSFTLQGRTQIALPGGYTTRSLANVTDAQIVREVATIQYWNGSQWVDYQNIFVDEQRIGGGVNQVIEHHAYFSPVNVPISPNLSWHYVREFVTYGWYHSYNGISADGPLLGSEKFQFTNDTYTGANAGPGYCLLGGPDSQP